MLEALLKRVGELERQLKEERGSRSPNGEVGSRREEERVNGDKKSKRSRLDTKDIADELAVYPPSPPRLAALLLGGESS